MAQFYLIRHGEPDYESVISIMSQVQDMHVEWRPDIYKHNENLVPQDVFEKMIENDTFYVAENNNSVVGVLEIAYRHVESPSHVTRDFIFVDTMAIDENYRGMGIGHKMFDLLKQIKAEKNLLIPEPFALNTPYFHSCFFDLYIL